ncbi:hypothetical protein [Leifsonia xyli]|uniref:hypothetical protein n=1 Tax=Leifsonia xyli TaxID=1575 RepID=UPI003D67C829
MPAYSPASRMIVLVGNGRMEPVEPVSMARPYCAVPFMFLKRPPAYTRLPSGLTASASTT